MPLNDYTSGSVIGKGTYGVVSLVKHKKDRKQYVIKRVDIHNASSREQKAAEQEANLLSKIRHPNIVSYKESFQGDSGVLFIVMAFCEGGDMYTRLKTQNGTHLEERQIVEWFVQIAMALQYLHDRHVLHRDLKTQNIFLTKSKIIKVGDLGIARVLENASDMATTLIGTPYYMSPELFSNKPYSYKSDVWALGCCLYEMCTLKHAFNAKDMNSLVYKILKGKLPAMPKIYSNDLCDIIRSMLLQEPEKRPSVARLLRHPFIKKQIALFLEGTKNRQKNSSKTKDVQKRPNSSGPDVMNKLDNVEAVPRQENEKKARAQRPEQSAVDVDSRISNGKQDKPDIKVDERKERRDHKEDNITVQQSDIHTEPKSDEKKKVAQRTSINDDRSSEQKPRRSRPLPPKPPSSRPNVELGALENVPRERRRLKVSKPSSESKGANRASSSPTDSKDSYEPTELKPKVSSGNPVSARERRRQRERESMGRPSLPSSISSSNSDRPLGPRLSNDSPGQPAPMSPVFDVTDGPPRRSEPPVKEVKSQKSDEGIDMNDEDTSEGSDLEPSSQEEVVSKHQQRRKVSNDVNSLISALDTTLKLSDDRTSPDMNAESVEEEPVEDISVSSGLLRNRIDFLRRDCIDGLGETDFQKASDIIDNQSEDNVQLALVELMGRKKFEKYGGKLWQLKFCETFKRT